MKTKVDRRKEVEDRLAQVMDPELDESLIELGFIDEIRIDGRRVTVSFKLPTYWCSPNFAFLMASDIRDRIRELDWVDEVSVRLKDHLYADAINDGVSKNRSFAETFPEFSSGELNQLRKTFRDKAFLARQDRLIRYLLKRGMTKTAILNFTIQDLQELSGDYPALKNHIESYLSIRRECLGTGEAHDTAFVKKDGRRIALQEFADYLKETQRTRVSMEFNAIHCRGLFQTRYHKEEE
ncbi:MAG: iron-sulfur cluster assembly protein [Bacillaceae bacterium]|nr:iron-sulfur cluster assembly protein [Bacillaceae bacterium]